MIKETRAFEVYGFRIEVHVGGRRVWPPSFKRFIKMKTDSGDLTIGEVMKTCNVSQSLVYKWRSEVNRADDQDHDQENVAERFFSEIVVNEEPSPAAVPQASDTIRILLDAVEVELPASYPVESLARLISSMGGPR